MEYPDLGSEPRVELDLKGPSLEDQPKDSPPLPPEPRTPSRWVMGLLFVLVFINTAGLAWLIFFQGSWDPVPGSKHFTALKKDTETLKASAQKTQELLAALEKRVQKLEENSELSLSRIEGLEIKLRDRAQPKPQVVAPPPTANPKERKPETVRYTVKKTDSLEGIARKFRVTAPQVRKWNGLKASVTKLPPGTVIIIHKE